MSANAGNLPQKYRPVGEIFSLVGEKWTVHVVAVLGRNERSMRFNELRREVAGISQKMLAATLRQLERDGFLSRTIFPVIPPRVEYELTELGRQLLTPLWELGRFAMEHRDVIEASRERFDADQANEVLAFGAVTVQPRHRLEPGFAAEDPDEDVAGLSPR